MNPQPYIPIREMLCTRGNETIPTGTVLSMGDTGEPLQRGWVWFRDEDGELTPEGQAFLAREKIYSIP